MSAKQLLGFVGEVCAPLLQLNSEELGKVLGKRDSSEKATKFASAESSVLCVAVTTKQEISVFTEMAFWGNLECAVVFVLLTGEPLSSSRSIASQLRFMSVSGADPIDSLFGFVHHTLLPLVAGATKKQDNSHAQAKPSESVDVSKTLKQLDLQLRVVRHDAEVPAVSLVIDSVVPQLIEQRKRGALSDAELEDMVQDNVLVERLTKNVKEWTMEVRKLFQMADSQSAKETASAEISFWVSLDSTLEDLKKQVDSEAVQTTLNLLLLARRTVIVDSFKKDNDIRTLIAKVDDSSGMNVIMRDFPLNKLLSATTVSEVNDAINRIFERLGRQKLVREFHVPRFLDFIEAIARDVSSQLGFLLENVLQADYAEFEKMFTDILNMPPKEGRTELCVVENWEEKIEKLLADLEKHHSRRKKTDSLPNSLQLGIKERLEKVLQFRQSHNQLWLAMASSGGFTTETATRQLDDAFKRICKMNIFELSSEEWDHAKKLYDDEAARSERQISSSLRDRLGGAKSAGEMFQIFARYGPLLKRPKILGAVTEYQGALFSRILNDLDSLERKLQLDAEFDGSQVGVMCRLRDLPPYSAKRMWFVQIRRQLSELETRLSAVLGNTWKDEPQGAKVREKWEACAKILNVKLGTKRVASTKSWVSGFGEIFKSWEDSPAKVFLESFDRRLKVFSVVQRKNGKHTIAVTFQPFFLQMFKEVRHFDAQGIKFSNQKLKSHATLVKDAGPYALMLHEAVETYQRVVPTISKKNDVLLAKQLINLQNQIRGFSHTAWDQVLQEDNTTRRAIEAFAEQVAQLDEKVTEMKSTMLAVSELSARLETCQLDAPVIEGIIRDMQKAVMVLAESQFSNMDGWVANVNDQVTNILKDKLRSAVARWVSNFRELAGRSKENALARSQSRLTARKTTTRGFRSGSVMSMGGNEVETEADELIKIPIVTLFIKLHNDQITVDPPIEFVEHTWTKHFHTLCRAFTSLPRLSSGYDANTILRANEGPGTFADIIEYIGLSDVKQAYQAMHTALTSVREYIEEWENYQALWGITLETISERLGDKMADWNGMLHGLRDSQQRLKGQRGQESCGAVVVNYKEVQQQTKKAIDHWHNTVQDKVAEKMQQNCKALHEELAAVNSKISSLSVSSGTKESVKLLTEVRAAEKRVPDWEALVSTLRDSQLLLEKGRFAFPGDWLDVEVVKTECDQLVQLMNKKNSQLDSGLKQMQDGVLDDDRKFEKRVARFLEDWQQDKPISSPTAAHAMQIMATFEEGLTILEKEQTAMIAAKQALNLDVVRKDPLQPVRDQLSSLKQVWTHLMHISTDMIELGKMRWETTDPKEVRGRLQTMYDNLRKLPTEIHSYQAWMTLRDQVDEKLKVNKLLVDLKAEAIKAKHWNQLRGILGVQWKVADATLHDLWACNLGPKEQAIKEVVRVAQGESALGQFLSQIKTTWAEYAVEQTFYQNRCWLVKGWETLFEDLARDISALEDMAKSVFYKAFEDEAKVWNTKLNKARDAFEVWLEVQRRWVYLDGIFVGSAEIKSQLGKEYKTFTVVDSEFMDILRQAHNSPLVVSIIAIDGLDKTLETIDTNLKMIQKALGEFLERQRQAFCRFYFIGDEDLLEIIGSAKDPESVQKHLAKLFAGINALTFSEDHDAILGMASKEGEQVPFVRPVENVKDDSVIGRLSRVEVAMRDTLAALLEQSMVEIAAAVGADGHASAEAFLAWIGKFPAQSVLLSIQVLWSQSVNDALATGDPAALKRALSIVEGRLNLLSDTVLRPLDPTLRKKIEQLLTELVHQKDVIHMLLSKGVKSAQDFDWLYQMRFHWDPQEPDPLHKLNIQIANASFYYGFEYLGIAEKLVQTALTDNIYLTLTQALHSKLGGCPFGPAGTGKTETVKMLGAQLGRFVLTFNCDENFDFNSMGRIFLGICQVGAWGCFDEFNRLEERMLSAVSSQILTIQTGLKTGRDMVELMSRRLTLNSNTGIFITMNPGYAGRSNLPDNLKQLFRNMACTAPDRDKIASVILYTRGFRSADTLSSKIVLLFNLCLAQLSAQPHYDFGLRALKSVLGSAGNLKRVLMEARGASAGKALDDDDANARFEVEVLIQSIYDTVVPKLVADDVPLLSALVRDVFPGVEYNRFIEPELRAAVLEQCKQSHLVALRDDDTDTLWLEKVWQLFQIQKLHHGLMLVGPSGTGKTKAIDVLVRAMEQVEKTKYDTYVIDPKAVTKDELYGVLDSTTMEWTDGVFTSILRAILGNARGERERNHWIIFDGDVDPEWVENLNSVLDDNRLLTLPNGERLAIPPNLHLVFEVSTLRYATLATVSRCGMIWFSDEVLEVGSILQHYLDTFSSEPIPNVPEEALPTTVQLQKQAADMLREHFQPSGFVLRAMTYCDTLEHVMEPSRMRSVNSMWCLFTQGIRHIHHYNQEHIDFPLADEVALAYMEKRLVFSVLFGFGGDLSMEGRYLVADQMYELVDSIPLPDEAQPSAQVDSEGGLGKVSLADFEVVVDDGQWHAWAERVPMVDVEPAKCIQSDVVIQTIDTVRNSEIAQSWLAQQLPMIFCGPPGSGKTMTLTSTLSNATDIELVGINFSAGTTPELILQIFGQYCEIKKSPHGLVMRPKRADKRLVVFCDEINLPANDKYGTQRVITFIRQMISRGGYWRASDCQWISFERVQFVGACNPPTDPGRVVLSDRFLRFAPVLLVDYPSEISMKQIYGTFVRALLQLHPALSKYHDGLTNAMVEVYLTSQRYYTTEMQAHYIYSPRELSRYIRAMYEAMIQHDAMTLEELVRLFTHEGLRLFYDRLVEDDSRKICDELFESVAKRHFPTCDLEVALKKPILYTTWITRQYSSVDQKELREFVRHRMRLFYEEELNVRLVVFDEVLDHVLRIDRVLRQPMGHALLIGMSGSGKSTLAHFVSWMNEMSIFKIKVSKAYSFENFESDLRVVMKRAGCDDKQVCFIFDEMASLGPAMIERMNALLASGEVPGLFEGEEGAALMHDCREAARRDGLTFDSDEELYKHFVKTVQRNLHIVFTMNPAGTDFASQATTSPALFNRCVVNWMGTWSNQALTQVGAEFTANVNFSSMGKAKDADKSEPGMEEVVDSNHAACVSSLTSIHKLVETAADSIRKRFDRSNYITPRSFLDIIHHFSTLLDEKQTELQQKEIHLTNGIDKLVQTKESVLEMQATLAEKQKVLEAQNRKAEEKLAEILRDQEEAKKTQKHIAEIGKQVDARKAEVTLEENKVKKELSQVEPLLADAKAAVNSIRKQNLDEVRALLNPPKLVRQAMEMVVTMLGETETSWDSIRKIMKRDNFISGIINFDSASLSKETRQKVFQQFFGDSSFTYDAVNNASRACGPLHKWGEAQLKYTDILESVQPLTDAIANLQKEMTKLEDQQKDLSAAHQEQERTIEKLRKEYGEFVAEAREIKAGMTLTQAKVTRSIKLLESLSSESERWGAQKNSMASLKGTLIGDCLLGAAFVAYGGYFDHSERSALLGKWAAVLRQHSVRSQDGLTMATFLARPDQKHAWLSRGLPEDDLCVENAAIIERYNRYPLVIDPSGQAIDFLMNNPGQSVVKSSFLDDSFVKNLESAVRFGTALLVQDVENLDPIINPLLNKQLTKASGRLLVPVGPNDIDFNPAFNLILLTRDPNPMFAPDLCSRVTFANFTITPASMENKCLNMILGALRPDVQQRHADLVAAQGELAYKLTALERQLLDTLNSATGNLLENEELMSTLETIKSEAAEVESKAADNERVMLEVNATLARFRPMAIMCRRLYFALEQHSFIHFMYQFSMESFMKVFSAVLDRNRQSGTSSKPEGELLSVLQRDLLKTLFDVYSVSLRKEDRELLAFRISEISFQDTPGQLAAIDLDYFLKGSASIVSSAVPPETMSHAQKQAETIASKLALDVVQRHELSMLLTIDEYAPLGDHILKHLSDWSRFVASDSNPPQWLDKSVVVNETTLAFKQLVVLKTLRPDRAVAGTRGFVNTIYPNLVGVDAGVNIDRTVHDVSANVPIFLASAPGYDSSTQVEDLAVQSHRQLQSLAMGTNEAAATADKAIQTASKAGTWVMLKNVHLDPSFLSQLSKMLPRLNPHNDFRLFLTSEIHPKIPRTLLLQSRLLIMEAAGGVKANLTRTLNQLTPAETLQPPAERMRVYFLLAWIHAILQERVRYYPVGWTKLYEFGESDRKATFQVVDEWLAKFAQGRAHLSPTKIPWQAIRTLIAQSTYGGRVENEFDQVLLRSFLDKFLNAESFDIGFKLFDSADANSPSLANVNSLQEYSAFVAALPDSESPSWLGLPALAERLITTRKGEALRNKLLKLRSAFEVPSGDIFAADADDTEVKAAWFTTLEKPISEWLVAVSVGVATLENSPENSASPIFRCFNRELRAFLHLKETINSQLSTLQNIGSNGLKATGVQHQMISLLVKEIVPPEFKKYAGKELGATEWFSDLSKRLTSLDKITTDPSFRKNSGVWLGGLMTPEAFITATRQAVAQKLQVSLQDLHLRLEIGSTKPSENAFVVKGLVMEGAKFEKGSLVLCDEMSTPLPDSQIVWNRTSNPDDLSVPVYLNSSRQELSFSVNVSVPQKVDKNVWYQRGLAIVLWSEQSDFSL